MEPSSRNQKYKRFRVVPFSMMFANYYLPKLPITRCALKIFWISYRIVLNIFLDIIEMNLYSKIKLIKL